MSGLSAGLIVEVVANLIAEFLACFTAYFKAGFTVRSLHETCHKGSIAYGLTWHWRWFEAPVERRHAKHYAKRLNTDDGLLVLVPRASLVDPSATYSRLVGGHDRF